MSNLLKGKRYSFSVPKYHAVEACIPTGNKHPLIFNLGTSGIEWSVTRSGRLVLFKEHTGPIGLEAVKRCSWRCSEPYHNSSLVQEVDRFTRYSDQSLSSLFCP